MPESERRDIYEDAIFHLAKREKEEEKALRKRNMKNLTRVLDSMTDITHRTAWTEAQQLLLDNPTFSEDNDLLGNFHSIFSISASFEPARINVDSVTSLWKLPTILKISRENFKGFETGLLIHKIILHLSLSLILIQFFLSLQLWTRKTRSLYSNSIFES